jgi:hypothetical protein
VLGVLLAVTPSPSPSLNVDQNAVTPGVVGFLAILFVTLVTVALIADMVRRIRRVRYRNELAERRLTEQPPQP